MVLLHPNFFSPCATYKFKNLKQGNRQPKLLLGIGIGQIHPIIPEKSGSEKFHAKLAGLDVKHCTKISKSQYCAMLTKKCEEGKQIHSVEKKTFVNLHDALTIIDFTKINNKKIEKLVHLSQTLATIDVMKKQISNKKNGKKICIISYSR